MYNDDLESKEKEDEDILMDTLEKEENLDYDQDIIYAQDIESGKDITDITDFEKEDGSRLEKEKVCRKNTNFVKKKFVGEQNDDEIIENEQENRMEGSDKRKVVEKSPKERFARFDEELGAGAFKRVFRGYDYDTGREIAWNVVNVSCMSDDAINKIQEEIAIIKKLKHPNIINFVSGFFNDEKKEVVIITEIFTCGSLKQYLNKIKHPRLKVIKFWCKEILKGLKYLHELPNPIIHRDIKCDNIFINGTTTEIKIGDLGYSCILRNNDYARSVSGTPEFMAPEVLTGKYGVLADIYSFGICVLEIVTREKPYKECENNLIDIFENIKNHVLPISIDRIKNQRLLEFIKSCFKPEDDRPSANELLNSEFLNDIEHEENNYPALQYPNLSESSTDNLIKFGNTSTKDINYFHSGMMDKISKKNLLHLKKSESSNKIKEVTHYFKMNKEMSPRNRNRYTRDEKIEEKLISPFELNINVINNSSATPKNKNNFANSIKKTYDIVGLRKNKTSSNNEISHLNQIKNFNKLDDIPAHCHSSSDDYDDVSHSKEFNEKFQYDPIVVKNSDALIKTKSSPNTSNYKKINPPLSSLSHLNPFSSHTKTFNAKSSSSSKIEIKIEEEYKDENAIKISLVKKEKPKHKGQKISFKFDLNNDTCEKIVKELENEKIGLNDEEKKIFTQKLTNLIRNYTNSTGKNNESFTLLTENQNQLLETKLLLDKFLKKYNKIMEETEEVILASKDIKEDLLENQNDINSSNINERDYDVAKIEFIEKMKILEEFLKLR